MADTLSVSFLGALQASVAVLLTMSYGVIAAQFEMLKGNSMKQLSTLCVRMLLPALLLTNVGSQLHSETAYRYVPILSKRCHSFVWGQNSFNMEADETNPSV